MTFPEALRTHLTRVQKELAPPPPLNMPALRAHLLDALDERERSGPGPFSAIQDTHRQLSTHLEPFARVLQQKLIEHLGPSTSPNAQLEMLQTGIRLSLDLPDMQPQSARRRELFRLVQEAKAEVMPDSNEGAAWSKLSAYASALCLTREASPGHARITLLGQVFLSLQGRDAVRWLLQLEVLLSTGPTDEKYLSREVASRMCQAPKYYWILEAGETCQFSESLLWHLVELRVLLYSYDDSDHIGVQGYEVPESSLPIFQELAKRHETPLSVLAETLLQDERERVVIPKGQHASAFGAQESVARHAKMVAHELRNTLAPLQTTLHAFFRQATAQGARGAVGRFEPDISRGLDRIFAFVDEMLQTATLPEAQNESLSLNQLVRDAIQQLMVEFPDISVTPALEETDLPPIIAERAGVTRAILNLLRNAAQASGTQGTIRTTLTHDAAAEMRILTVEDNGPGVQESSRVDIFKPGFSLRAGGSGQGLALVRAVFEDQMHGQVTCSQSTTLGGACFTVQIPYDSVPPKRG